MSDDIIISPYDPKDDDELYKLVSQHLSLGRTKDDWRWRFKAPPIVRCVVARINGKIVGQYVATGLPITGSNNMDGLLSVDTVVHSDYHRRGIFRKMHDAFYDGLDKQYGFAMGVVGSHRKSPESFAAVGWETLCPLQWYRFHISEIGKEGDFECRLAEYHVPNAAGTVDQAYEDWRYSRPGSSSLSTAYGSRLSLIDSKIAKILRIESLHDLREVADTWGRKEFRWLGASHDPFAQYLASHGAEVLDSGYTFIGKALGIKDGSVLKAENWYPEAGIFDTF